MKSCSTNFNKFRTTEARSKAILRTNGWIDQFLNILNLQKFREWNHEWSEKAKERYNVTEPLFYEDQMADKIKAVPNKRAFKAIDNAKGIFYQEDEVPVSTSSPETITKVKRVIESMGVKLQSLSDYLKGNPNVDARGVNALADLTRGIIAIAHGKENVALTEEMVHVATAILEQINPQMVTQMIGKIGNFKIYQQVFDVYSKKKDYQTSDGKPNIRKIKKEAVDKLIVELIIRQSEGSTEFPDLLQENNRINIRSWWQKILDWFRSLYKKSDIDIFEEAAQKIISGGTGARYYNDNKLGVDRIFEENPELANRIYEAMGLPINNTINNTIDEIDIVNKYKGSSVEFHQKSPLQDALEQIIQKTKGLLNAIKIIRHTNENLDELIVDGIYTPNRPLSFTEGWIGKNIFGKNRIYIRTQKGLKALSLGSIQVKEHNIDNKESELVLSRSLQYKVITVNNNELGGKDYYMEIVNSNNNQEETNAQITPQQKLQAQQQYSSYLQTTNNPTIEGFKQWNNKQQQINELFESNPELANAVYETLGFKQTQPQNLIDHIKELSGIKETPSAVFLRTLLNSNLLPFISEAKIKKGLRSGQWTPISNVLEVNYPSDFSDAHKAKLLAHELVHSISFNYAFAYELEKGDISEEEYKRYYKNVKVPKLSTEQIKAFDELKRIKSKVHTYLKENKLPVLDRLGRFGDANYVFYGSEGEHDLHEFISEVFTNPELIQYLKNIPSEGRKTSLFQSFIDAIAKIFGVQTSIINDIVALSEEAFIKDILDKELAQKQQAQQLYAQYLSQNPNGNIEGFKQWNNRQQEINELFESNPKLANEVYEALGFKSDNQKILAIVREQNFNVYQYENGFEAILNKEWLNEELEENNKQYNDNVKNIDNIIDSIRKGKKLSDNIENIIDDTFNGFILYDKSNDSYSIYHYPGSIGFEDFDAVNKTNREGKSAYEPISLQDIKKRLLLGFKDDLKSKNKYTNIRASKENKDRIEDNLQHYVDTYYQYEEGKDVGGLLKRGYIVPKNKGYIIRSAGGGALNHIPGAFPAIKAYFYYEGKHQMGEEDAYVLIDRIDNSGVYIRYTTVKKELRGKGIASLLLNRIRKDYPNLPIIRTMIDNPIIVEQSRHIKGARLTNGKPLPTFDEISFGEWQDTQYSDIYLPPLNEETQITPEQKQQAQQLYSQYLDTKQPDVILPIGTSGSGKSTFIKSLPQENLVVIEPDAMRVEFTGNMNDKSKDKEIYKEAAKRAVEAIKNGKQVVFDTTNLTKDKRLPFIEAIKKAIPTANIQYKLMELNPELAKQRIKAQLERGENRAAVSDETIDRHAASYKQMLEDIKDEPITEYKELGSKQDIEGFKEWMKTAPAEFKGEGVFFQIKNDLVDAYYNTIKSWAARLNVVEEDLQKGTPRYYTLDGQGKISTVTQKVKRKQKFATRTEAQKAIDDMKKQWGTEGHNFIMNYIKVNLIDKDGYVRERFGTADIDTPLNSAITEKLGKFAQELVRSFRPGTRILVEERIINTRVKGMLASTFDFKAIEPTADGKDIKIHTLDWKFMGINKEIEEDVPFYKQREWIPQMGEYTRIDYNYGAKPSQIGMARMIPFQLNYKYKVSGDSRSGLYPASIEIGNLDPKKESNLYLLPVPTDVESAGSKEVDTLLKSLTTYYQKLINKRVSPEERLAKRVRLAELSKAIRLLRWKLDFKPLYEVAKSFQQDAKDIFKSFENIDYTKLTQDDIKEKLKQLLELKASAEKFSTIDDVFLSIYPSDELTKSQYDLLVMLERVVGRTGRLMREIDEIQKKFVVQYALKEGYTTEETKETILEPQKEITGLARTLMELSRLPNRIINIVANAIMNARSYTDIKIKEMIDEYTKLLLPLEKLAKSQGKSAFDYIGKVVNGELRLIEKIDKGFWEELERKKVAKNKQFLIDNLNMEEYRKLAKETIDRISDEIKRTYSSDEQAVKDRREFELKKLKNALDIESKNFDGYNDRRFAYVFNKTMRADLHYSEDYKKLLNIKEAHEVWKFFTALNERGIKNGYLSHRKISFFALIEATMLQKLAASDSILHEAGNIATDLYTVKINEEHLYSRIDQETGEIKREIPRLFTKTNKEVHQLSRDLTKVGILWIRALMEYEMAERMKDTLLVLENVERNKGHIVVDERGEPVREGGQLKIEGKTNKSADVIKTIIDDFIFGIHEDASSIGTASISTLAAKTTADAERAQEKAISAKKGLENMNMLTQSLAVGLKLTVAIPNYFGVHFQSFINNGGMYTYSEFFKNHLKIITNINLSTIEKGLMDMLVPLNGDVAVEEHRKLAAKQGFVKWLSSWNIQEFMMSTNYLPERNLQFTNALSHIDNAMVVDGKIVNIRQYLKAKERERYSKMSYKERREFEKGLDKRVEALKASSSLAKVAKIENDRVVIPGVSDEELAKFRTKIVEWGRNLNGQMSQENKAGYRRDILLKSFAMFRNWIPKQFTVRAHDIQKNLETGDWEYGRTRAFMKAYLQVCHWNIRKMFDIMHGTERGLAILDEMLQQKRDDYFRKNGIELDITTEEFYDMMRTTLSNEMKELGTLLSLMTIVLAAKAAAPPEEDDTNKNIYKYVMRLINKSVDEVRFYYDPLSFLSMTRGSFLPALGTIGKVQRALNALTKEIYGLMTDDEEMVKKAYPLKYFIDIIPIGSQFEREILPIIAPDVAKEMGIRIVEQPRIRQ